MMRASSEPFLVFVATWCSRDTHYLPIMDTNMPKSYLGGAQLAGKAQEFVWVCLGNGSHL